MRAGLAYEMYLGYSVLGGLRMSKGCRAVPDSSRRKKEEAWLGVEIMFQIVLSDTSSVDLALQSP